MSLQNIFTKSNKTNIVQDIEWGESFDNTPIGQPDILISPLSPSPSDLPSEQSASNLRHRTAGSKRSTQENTPKGAINSYFNAYKALDSIPASWDIFAYNSFGELEPGRTYSAQDMVQYLYRNPKHRVGETYSPKLGGLTLWIQRTPHKTTLRHGHPKASLCRFENCEHDNVIKAGDVRVAFDELTKYNSNLDAKHNAGYVHLCCLEKNLNFPMLCKDLDVQPENRALPLEREQENPMMLRDSIELEHVWRFIDFCNNNGRPPRSYPHLGRLIDEILKLGRSELKGHNLEQWQKFGVKWSDEQKAKMDHTIALARVARRRFVARAKEEAAKMTKTKRAREEKKGEVSGRSVQRGWKLEKRRPQPKQRSRVIKAKAPTLEFHFYVPSSLSEIDSESEEEEVEEEKVEEEEVVEEEGVVEEVVKEDGEAPTQTLTP